MRVEEFDEGSTPPVPPAALPRGSGEWPARAGRGDLSPARGLLLIALGLLCLPVSAVAQRIPPEEGGLTYSMGFPPRARPHFGFAMGSYGRGPGAEGQAQLGLGLYKDLVNPVMSLVGLMVDGYGAIRTDGDFDGGLQAQIHSPLFRLAAGVDYSIRDGQGDFILSLIHPVQRGGIIFDGGLLRASWLPGRGHTVTLGIQAPFGVPRPGRARPARETVVIRPMASEPVPEPADVDAVEAALDDLVALSAWMAALLVPFIDQGGDSHDASLESFRTLADSVQAGLAGTPGVPAGAPTAQDVVVRYHEALQRAFSVALDPSDPGADPRAPGIAEEARTAVLDQILIPHNALLGQYRDVRTLDPLVARARGAFIRMLDVDFEVGDDAHARIEWLFERWTRSFETIRARQEKDWGDERMTWLPLQLALRPEDHDEQTELDAIIERVTGASFHEGNDVDYILNEEFQQALFQTIHSAEDYHVLWVHDVRGYDVDGEPDLVAYRQVLHGYLEALIDRVEAYDETGRLTEYHLFLDQWFYEVNGGRLWLELLADPLRHRVDLPDGFEGWEEELDSAQRTLERAVAGSRRLQAEARSFGRDWLRNRVKVHVHVTNQPDPTFWSPQILPLVGMPDNILRDHRKIVLWDLSEADPSRGGMILTGMGVGEHYAGAGWEDRAVVLQGPAAVRMKEAAREHLLEQGLVGEEIPWVLRPVAATSGAAASTVQGDILDIRATQLHNLIGFGRKEVSVAKAVLYSLMEPGAVIKAPDSLWNQPLWASLLLGSALRGARVLMITPALENAPAAGWPQMARAYELVSRLLVAQSIFAPNFEAAGGLFRVGIYHPGVAVGDIPGRLDRFLATLEQEPWLADLYELHPTVPDSLRALSRDLRAGGFEPSYLTYDWTSAPKLHIKAQLMASGQGWDHLLAHEEWATILTAYFRGRAAHVANDDRLTDFHELSRRMAPVFERLHGEFFGTMDPETLSRVEYYLLAGSHNQDYRSMIMDGEVELLVSGLGAVVGIEDFLLLPGLSEWIETEDELQVLLPAPSSFRRRIARIIRSAL